MEDLLVIINNILNFTVAIVWSWPLVATLLGSGLFFTFYFRAIQFRHFSHAIKVVMGRVHATDSNTTGELSHFKALCTALSGTVGLGNIAGVAVAISVGGPGATFWMILVGFLGMAVKFTESSLACIHRRTDKSNKLCGGPMYYIADAPGGKYLSKIYAFFITISAIGAANMFQANQVALAFQTSFKMENFNSGLLIAVPVFLVIIGGVKRIGDVASLIVPVMALLYITACLIVIVTHIDKLPDCIVSIFTGAFAGTAAIGGFSGATLKLVIEQGVRRALFSSESGLGTSATAHAMVKTKEPLSEGFVAMLEPFIDTVIICTLTALAVNITDTWNVEGLKGVAITTAAFNSGIEGMGTYLIPISVYLFAVSTIISWFLYGEQAVHFLGFQGPLAIYSYKVVYVFCILIGAIWELTPILSFSDICFGLLVIPNTWAMFYFRKEIRLRISHYVKVHIIPKD